MNNNSKLKMDLRRFKRSISLSILFPLMSSLIITSLLFVALYTQDAKRRETLAQQNLYSTKQIFESGIAGKLAIIASSNVFLDFITSGDITRNEIQSRFLAQLSTLNSKSIAGFKIWYNAFGVRKDIFTTGDDSNDYITLGLCYSGSRLDSHNGSCYYFMRLFFSRSQIIKELKKINTGIEECKKCKPLQLFDNDKFGDFIITEKSHFWLQLKINEKQEYIFYLYIIFMLILLFFAIFNRNQIIHLINRVITKPLDNLVNEIKNNKLTRSSTNSALLEIDYLTKQIDIWKEQLDQIQQIEKEAAIGQVTAQVAHDIRSPLAALEISIQDTDKLPEDTRLTIRKAIQRIHDIANSLPQSHRGLISHHPSITDNIDKQLVCNLIRNIVSEKRLQLRSKSSIQIETEFCHPFDQLFANINKIDFSRVLSNLINNAVEALEYEGKVVISLTKHENRIRISIVDTGKGMPTSVISQLGQKGFSYNKTKGSGLGLYHAKQSIKQCGGEILITSTIDKGTNVTIFLPLAQTPPWYVTNISLASVQYVFIIDDDNAVHEIWDKRLEQFQIKNKATLHIKHFYSIQEFKDSILRHNINLPITYLCDYEFIGENETGIDLIKNLGIAFQSKLVTNRHDDAFTIEACLEHGISILPKCFAETVSLTSFIERIKVDAILIDDDYLVRESWKISSYFYKKTFKAFDSYESFLSEMENLSFDIPIYLDSNLGGEIKGEDIAKNIYTSGFKVIYLVTGYEKSFIKKNSFLKGILGKSPPWSILEAEH